MSKPLVCTHAQSACSGVRLRITSASLALRHRLHAPPPSPSSPLKKKPTNNPPAHRSPLTAHRSPTTPPQHCNTTPPLPHSQAQAELASLREDLAPAWFQQPLALEATAERYVRPALRQTFVDLMRQPISAYLERHAFKSDLLKAMYATTDAFSGLSGGLDTPGTGANFLLHNMVGNARLCDGGIGLGGLDWAGGAWRVLVVKLFPLSARPEGSREADAEPHVWPLQGEPASDRVLTPAQPPPPFHSPPPPLTTTTHYHHHSLSPPPKITPLSPQCRLPGSDGTWMVIKGGMGAVTQALKTAALQAGARIHTSAPVAAVERSGGSGGAADGVLLEDGSRHTAKAVVVNADPFRMQALVGQAALPAEFNTKLEGLRRPGNTMKVSCLVAVAGAGDSFLSLWWRDGGGFGRAPGLNHSCPPSITQPPPGTPSSIAPTNGPPQYIHTLTPRSTLHSRACPDSRACRKKSDSTAPPHTSCPRATTFCNRSGRHVSVSGGLAGGPLGNAWGTVCGWGGGGREREKGGGCWGQGVCAHARACPVRAL